MPTAIVSGALANKPLNGGNAWTRLGWVIGLRKVGYEVYFVEQIGRENCIDGDGAKASFGNSVNLEYFRTVMERFGLADRCALVCEGGEEVFGMPLSELDAQAAECSFLLNISGHLSYQGFLDRVACKVYLDDDPGFTQLWHATGSTSNVLGGHNAYFTIGNNIGSAPCTIPTGGIRWTHTRPPVVLDQWPCVPSRRFDRFTTVCTWRGAYGPIEYGGKKLGQKAHEFRKFLPLPRRTARQFEIALDIHPGDHKDLEALRSHGWTVTDPRNVARSPQAYRSYLQGSGAEFSPAQGVYVQTQSGWFSDRTARYLASGRPVLVQDTGFSRYLPVGEGLLAFSDFDEAVERVERITKDYTLHCAAARKLAEEYFDSDKVVGALLREIGLRPGSRRLRRSGGGHVGGKPLVGDAGFRPTKTGRRAGCDLKPGPGPKAFGPPDGGFLWAGTPARNSIGSANSTAVQPAPSEGTL